MSKDDGAWWTVALGFVAALASSACSRSGSATKSEESRVASASSSARTDASAPVAAASTIPPAAPGRPGLTLLRLVGPTLNETVEDVPAADPKKEKPSAGFTTPDKTLFVLTATSEPPMARLYRRSATGAWKTIHTAAHEKAFDTLSLFGAAANDLWATIDGNLVHFDGSRVTRSPKPPGDVTKVVGTKQDVFITTLTAEGATIYRRQAPAWVPEKTPKSVFIGPIGAGGTWLWSVGGANAKGEPVALGRGVGGKWTERTISPAMFIRAAFWVSPSGDPFVFTGESVLRGSADETKWTTDSLGGAGLTSAVWGRSSTDVWAATSSRLIHFDGKTWTPTAHGGKDAVVSGTEDEVFVVRAN